MKRSTRVVLLVVSFLCAVALAEAQTTASVQVADVHRTRLLDMVDHKLEPREPGQILLVLRIEGISLEAYKKVAQDQVVLHVGEGRHTPAFQTSSAARTSFVDGKPVKTISPWIVIAFSVPSDATNMKLAVGNHPLVAFKPTGEISDRLSILDL